MKLSVVFPGIGYHADKPLLYYSAKAAAECGWQERVNVNYSTSEKIVDLCASAEIPLQVIEGGNHSLETGHVLTDLANLQKVMEKTAAYLK